ncbi:MAG: 6-phospho-3-hexuloisomerase [Candidatus Altiarchaeales archaeon ex4484_96]|nr:MAG: 6-phospho-3-hexuloisomerase [Candidatus Altiarchaeales archaeon ex4484_96]
MPVTTAMVEIVRHIDDVIGNLDEKQIKQFIKVIQKSNRVFLIGAGRSGLAARAFAMRLVQLGLTAYVIGESVTPGMKKDDLLIAVSGSGQTNSVVSAAQVAKGLGCATLAITSYPDSLLGEIVDYVVVIKGRTKIDIEKDHLKHQIEGRHSTLTPLGTLFEDSVMVFFDGIIAGLMTTLKAREQDLKARHATIE